MPWQADSSFPLCRPGNTLAEALALHKTYADLLDGWHAWLESPNKPSAAEQLLLWQIIEVTKERRQPGHEWASIDTAVIPNPAAISSDLRPSYATFSAGFAARRQALEAAATGLVTVLDSPELLTELNAMDEVPRWENAAQLLDGLAETNVGMLHLRKSVALPLSPAPGAVPVANLAQLTGSKLTFQTATARTRRGVRAYAQYALKIMVPMVAEKEEVLLQNFTLDYIAKLAPRPADILPTAALTDQLDAFNKQLVAQRPWWFDHAELLAGVQGVLDVVNLCSAAYNVRRDGSPTAWANLVRATSSLVGSAFTYAKEAFPDSAFTTVGKSVTPWLARLNGVVDVLLAARAIFQGIDAFHVGDYKAAAGQWIQAVGLTTAAAAGVWASVTSEGVILVGAAVVPGAQLVVLGALVLVLVGSAVVELTTDTSFDTWLKNSWFGANWDNVTADAGPETPMFLAKGIDHAPDILRQASFWVSTFFPLKQVTATSTADRSITVGCLPSLATRRSDVGVWRIDHVPQKGSVPAHYTRFPIFSARIDDTSHPGVGMNIVGDAPDQRVDEWAGTFPAHEWAAGLGTPSPDPKGMWIEIEVSLPGELATELITPGATGPLTNFSYPLSVRARTKVS